MKIVQNENSRPHVFFALRTKLDVGVIPPGIIPPKSVDPPSCCTMGIDAIHAFADPANPSDTLKNDRNGFLFHRDLPSENWTFQLEKFTGAWISQANLDGTNDYALYYDWAKYETKKEFKGVQVQWLKVFEEFEDGYYRIKGTKTGYGAMTWYSQIYCLRRYSDQEADGTVRFDWYLNGNQSCIHDKSLKVDYGTINWFDSIRVVGMFGFESSDTAVEETKYETGEMKSTQDKVTVKYKFKSGLLNYRTHYYLAYNALLSQSLKVTDYCRLNDNPNYKEVPIRYQSGYSPDYLTYNLNSRVDLEFKDRVDNVGRQIC